MTNKTHTHTHTKDNCDTGDEIDKSIRGRKWAAKKKSKLLARHQLNSSEEQEGRGGVAWRRRRVVGERGGELEQFIAIPTRSK